MKRLKPSGKGLIGVDITSTAIKLIELSRAGIQLQIESYSVEPLRHGAVVERRIRDCDEVASVLRRVLDNAQPGSRHAVAMVPSSAAITKSLMFPAALGDAEVEARIPLASDKYIPFPFSEVAFDFQRLEHGDCADGQQEILLVACRQQDVEQLRSVLDQAGLVPAAVDVESFAIERAFAALRSPLAPGAAESVTADTVALVDIGASLSTFHVLHHGRIIYSRDSAVGGHLLTGRISDHYDLPLETAEVAKQRGSLPQGYTAQVLAPFIASLAEQIARSLQLYYTAGRTHRVEQLVLTGGSSVMPGLAERLAEACAMPVTRANLLMQMRSAARIDRQHLASIAPGLLNACGLAMRASV